MITDDWIEIGFFPEDVISVPKLPSFNIPEGEQAKIRFLNDEVPVSDSGEIFRLPEFPVSFQNEMNFGQDSEWRLRSEATKMLKNALQVYNDLTGDDAHIVASSQTPATVPSANEHTEAVAEVHQNTEGLREAVRDLQERVEKLENPVIELRIPEVESEELFTRPDRPLRNKHGRVGW